MKNKKWDLYYLSISREVGKISNCSSRKIGAVLVKGNRIIATGVNGVPEKITHCSDRPLGFFVELDREVVGKNEENDNTFINANWDNPTGGCPRKVLGYPSGQGLYLCAATHAEANAIITAARNGISTVGATLYLWCWVACKDCMKEIINAGIKRMVCLEGEWDYDPYSKLLLEESGIELTVYKKEEIEDDRL